MPAAATSVVAPDPVRRAGFVDGSLTVTLSGAATNAADAAEIVVTNAGGTVAAVDVSALIAGGGSKTITLPSGSATAAPGAAIYGVAVHSWKVGSELATGRWSQSTNNADLSGAASASVALTMP
jgi:hypothetical protein